MMAARLTSIIVMVIVVATIIAGLIAGAQRDDSGPIDLIILNGRVYTADGTGRFAEAVAIRGNQILRVGTNREIKRLRRPQTEVIDAHGGAVLPGFNDARAQLVGTSPFDELSLFRAATLEHIQDTIRAFAAAEPDRSWIVGRGWSFASFPSGSPTRQQLDAVVKDRPAYFLSRDGHAGWANSKALALAGITRRTPSPEHGLIVKDVRTGMPIGVLKEDARRLIERLLPQPSREERLAALRLQLAQSASLGITSIQTAGDLPADLDLYDELRREGQLSARLYAILAAPATVGPAQVDELDQVRRHFPDDPLLKAGGISLSIDGSTEAKAAFISTPSTNRGGHSAARYSAAELRQTISVLDARAWQIMMETAGDAATKLALNAYSSVLSQNAPAVRERRHRLVGLETLDEEDVSKLVQLQLIAEQAPLRAMLAAPQPGLWPGNIDGRERGWIWQTLIDKGARLIFGSDSPSAALDPMMGLYAAINRRSPESPDLEPWLPDERMQLPAAIDAYTKTPAYASFDEQRKGVLVRGMLADIVILSADIFSLAPERILDGRVDVTIFDGKVIFERQPIPAGTH